MLKLLGAALVLLSCGAAGAFLAEEKKKRLQSLREAKQFFLALQGEIRYGGTPLQEAMEVAGGRRAMGNLSPAFLEIAERMEQKSEGSFSVLWEEALSKRAKGAALKAGDLERLFRVGESLGQLDRETQLNCLEYYLAEVSHDIEGEEAALTEKVRLCRWLGALAGIFLCILML